MDKKEKQASLSWIMNVAGIKKLYILFLMLIHMLQGASSVCVAVVMKKLVDCAVSGEKHKFCISIGLLAVILVVQIVLSVISRFLDEYTYATLENVMKKRLFSFLLTKDYSSVMANHSGEWMNRLTSDASIVADGLTHILPGVMGLVIRLFGALSMIFFYIPGVAYIIVPGGLILVVFTYCVRKVMKRLHKEVREADGNLRVFLQENLSSMMVVRTFAKEENVSNRANDYLDCHKGARIKKNNFSTVCNVGFTALMNGVYILCVGYCGFGIVAGNIKYGTLVAVMQLVGQVQSPLATITGYLPKYYAMIASAERLMEAEEYDEDTRKLCDMEEIKTLYSDINAIGVKNGEFAYVADGEDKVLHNICFEIQKGDFVAITGPSGCGKSTLLKVLMGLYPLDEGEKYIAINGKVEELSGKYRKLFAYVPQGNHLMRGTIREVVTFYDNERIEDEEHIWYALKMACAYEFVREHKEGLDMVLTERGGGLSEGQMQRIAIARAIFADCPVLVLDEATSALDENTEKQVLDNVHNMTDKTVIIVTHRPAALQMCNRKIEM